MITNKSLIRWLACTILAAFVYTSILYEPLLGATTLHKESKNIARLTQRIDQFMLPYRYGRIVSGSSTGSDSLIIHIQDLHNNAEVQKNISEIITLFDYKYGISKVFVEGAPEGKVDTGFLSTISDEKIQKQTIESLLNKGILSGAEYYSILNKKDNL